MSSNWLNAPSPSTTLAAPILLKLLATSCVIRIGDTVSILFTYNPNCIALISSSLNLATRELITELLLVRFKKARNHAPFNCCADATLAYLQSLDMSRANNLCS